MLLVSYLVWIDLKLSSGVAKASLLSILFDIIIILEILGNVVYLENIHV